MARFRQWLTLSSWTRIVPGLKETFTRFPLPLICVTAVSIISLLSLHDVRIVSSELTGRLLYSLSYGAVALTSLKLWVESKKWSRPRHAVSAIVVMAMVLWYVWGIIGEWSFPASVYVSAALLLSLLFAPYINRDSDQPSVWYFNYQTGVAVFFAGLAAVVLGVGIAIILSSLHYLFDIKIPSKIYGDVWILVWSVLFPVYVLANISRQFDYESESCTFPKGIRFITNYILVPLMVVYMAILYAYFVRIIVQWELPRGRLTWMIAVFGTMGIITKLLAYPIRNSGMRLLAWFDRYYYLALIVPIILLAIAIGVRIHDYGVTEKRYTIVVMGLWFASVVLLALYKKDRFHIKYVPAILAVLLLVGAFGPWGAVEVSTRSQVSRFESLLSQYHLFRNGQVVKADSNIPFPTRKKLSSIADYLCANEQRFKRIRPWFETLLADAGKKESVPCVKMGSDVLVNLMGVKYVYFWQVQTKDKQSSFDYSNRDVDVDRGFIDVSGFDFVGRGYFYQYQNRSSEHKYELQHNAKQTAITVKFGRGHLSVNTESGDGVSFDIKALIRTLRKQHVITITRANRKKMSLTEDSTRGRFKARLVLTQVQGKVSGKHAVHITDISYFLMLKFKDSHSTLKQM